MQLATTQCCVSFSPQGLMLPSTSTTQGTRSRMGLLADVVVRVGARRSNLGGQNEEKERALKRQKNKPLQPSASRHISIVQQIWQVMPGHTLISEFCFELCAVLRRMLIIELITLVYEI
ncbi:hypothetical protein CEUSTIGMA_g7518.t1 [Chlamydomonas eustigma]|uniref:Uncharacterized protein n=1 Tax=Chlamydomonas eustigma TaxID=1157962 RepID=A0A250XBE0_9CHLO|nr:hypothetical protein CEUSTIGMA_g7518.t1 [Chlamydomonas eustigma]|eukprot:GAX80080.1 hypothetical protein CEUSTIGMA_g7518.t1 [Chlamydomonas eustigma]